MTKKQKLFVETYVTNPMMKDVDLAKLIDCTPEWICRIKKDPVIKAEIDKRQMELWNDAKGLAMKRITELADKGNVRANELILKSTGMLQDNINVSADVNNKIQIVIDNNNE